MNSINTYIDLITNIYIDKLGLFGALLIVIIGSFIPPIPDATFFALTTNSFGYVQGILISYLGTLIGASLVYYLFSLLSKAKWIQSSISKRPKIKFYINKFNHISLPILTVAIAIPFLPAFAIHVAAGFVRMSYKKFLIALLIGKLSLVIFWSYVGQTIIDGVTNPRSFLILVIIILVVYIVSKIISKKLKLEE